MTLSRQSAVLVRFLFLAVLLSASAAFGVSRAAAQATLQSDQADYYPGDHAVLTGTGFMAGEDVAILVRHNDATPDSGEAHASWTVTADASGSFTTIWVVCGDDCLGSSLLATADGQTSGLHAEATFTDSPKVGSVALGPQSGPLCSGTAGTVSFPVTVKRGSGSGSNGNFTATMSTSGLPGTVTAVFTPNPFQVVSQADSMSGTLSLTTTAATPSGTIPFRVKATTSASDTAGVAGTLTINQGPGITCPANITLSNTTGLCARTGVTFTATATGDPAPTITFSPASGSTFPVGTTTVNATATNSCGSTSCSFTVTINDTEKPSLVLPSNIVASAAAGQCGAVVTFAPTATDNCPGVTLTSTPASGSTFTVGTTTVTVTANDTHGNSSTGTFTVTVNDTEKPVLSAHADITVSNDPGVCGAVVTFTPPTATDNCPGVGTVTSTPVSGSTFPVGTTTVTSTVTDAHGNTQTSTFQVTVNDTEKPSLTVPADITVSNDAGVCAAVVSFTPTASDNCPGVTFLSTPASGSTFPVGTTTVSVTATDAHGNATTKTFQVTVNDTEKPVLSAHADITVSNDAGVCGAVVTFASPTATDNCPGVGSVTSTPASGSTFPVGTTTVTSTVTDAHGNTQTSTFQVTVNDTEKPSLTVPANITVSNDPGLCGAAVSFSVTASDNCPGVTVTGPASGTFFPTGTTTVAETATDAHGNAITKTFTVTVNDTEKPVLTVPANITVSNDAGLCGAVVTFTTSATDNCGGVGTITSTPASGSTFPVGTTTVTSNVMDFSGNTTTETFTVTVNDTEKPSLTVPANITVNNDPGVCGAVVTFTASAADNCPGVGTVTSTPASGSTFPVGTTTVTSSVTDAHGNTATETFTVTVNDTEKPSLTVPANITVSNDPGVCGAAVSFTVTATDNCPGVTVNGPASGTFFPTGTTTVVETATDAHGNAITKTFTVTVNDTEKPVLTVPANITVSNDAGVCGAVVTFTTSATDNCGGVGTITSTPASGTTFPVGTTTVTSTVMDFSGNTTTETFTVTVNDTEKPVVTVPANITVNNDAGVCGAVVAFTPIASDNCPGVTFLSSPASGSTFPVGTTTVSVTATDAHGNTATETFTVTVNDTEKPSLTVPANITVSNDPGLCGAAVSFTVTATDNCPGVTVNGPASGTFFPTGTTTVVETATDAHGNATSKSFTVTVNDTEKPVLTVPANITVSNDAGVCGAVVTFTTSATDNCGGVGTITSTPASGTTFPVGTTTVTSTVMDFSGNTTTETFTVTVNDTEKPSLTVPADITVSNDAGVCGAVISFTPTASDNCPGVTFLSTPASGTTFPVGTTTVSVTATDAHGNTTTKTFDVTVNDTEKPVLTVPANITVSNDPGVCGAAVSFTVTATDNCPGVTVTGPASGTFFPTGTTTVAETALDAHGNATTKTFTVTVNDTEKPVLTVPANITVNNDAGVCGAVVTFTTSATDNCIGVGTITSTPASGSTFPVGTTTVTSTVMDFSGNTTTETFTVTVNDTEHPSLTVPANITVSNDAGVCGAAVSFTPTASDNCPGVTFLSTPLSGSTFPVGTTTVSVTATDAHGNTTTKTFDVTVNDTEKPVITTSPIAANTDPGVCTATVTLGTTATDNCLGVTLNGTRSDGLPLANPFPKGVTTITWTAGDAHGNGATATQTVTVTDHEQPTITPPAVVNAQTGPTATICGLLVPDAVLGAPVANDNCSVTVTRTGVPAGNIFPVGSTTITYTVDDGSGNTAAGTQLVTVLDKTPPVLTAPPAVSATTGAGATICGKAISDATLGAATASDNCSVTVSRSGVPAGNLFPVGTTTITFTALDPSGNTTVRTQTVTVTDNTPPVITTADRTVSTDAGLCTAAIASLGTSVTDNCAGTLTLVGTRGDGLPLASPFPKGSTTVTWVATDASGNTSNATQTVTVTNPPPTAAITAPASGFIIGVGQPVAFAGTFTDNTGDTHTVQWSVDAITFNGTVNEAAQTTAGSFTFGTAGVYAVKMTVKDQCNQTAVATQVVGLNAFVVVYDPSAGFVTGGGWINSPAGAYAADPTLTGKANFGFVSKYKKGSSTPEGETEFQFQAGSLNFHSVSYDWLVIGGARAQFKGSGTINDAGNYGFLLTSVDGDVNGGGGKDKFRMKITNKTTGSTIYDSQLGAADSSAASTVLGGGSIVIHTNSGFLSATAPAGDETTASKNALYPNAPNPFNPSTTLRFTLAEPGRTALRVYNVRGELVRTLQESWLPAGTYQVAWDGKDARGRGVSSGTYFAVISSGAGYRDRIRMVLLK